MQLPAFALELGTSIQWLESFGGARKEGVYFLHALHVLAKELLINAAGSEQRDGRFKFSQ